MASYTFSNPFAPLNLTLEAESQLRDVAKMFVHKALVEYDTYMHLYERRLDLDTWKLTRQRDELQVFRRRTTKRNRKLLKITKPTDLPTSVASSASASSSSSSSSSTSSSRDSTSSLSSDDDEIPEGPAPPPPTSTTSTATIPTSPLLLAVGTFQGDLFDTMYGGVHPTIDCERILLSYVHDVDVVNAAVLATIDEPTLADPFRCLTVRWAIKNQPAYIRHVIKNRDLVFLYATGLVQLPRTLECVGYKLFHSVHFPQTHELEGTLRGHASICVLFRQHQDNVVETYARGFLEPKGRLMRAAVIRSASDLMLSFGRNIVCAHHKKLAYALRRRHMPTLHGTSFDGRLEIRHQQMRRLRPVLGANDQDEMETCEVCGKTKKRQVLRLGKMARRECRLCLQRVCKACSVKKKLSSISPEDRTLHQKHFTLCLLCVTAVTQANAFEIACDEIRQQDACVGYGRMSDDEFVVEPSSEDEGGDLYTLYS